MMLRIHNLLLSITDLLQEEVLVEVLVEVLEEVVDAQEPVIRLKNTFKK
jgi:hypothetical protein